MPLIYICLQGLVERDAEIKKTREENLKIQRELEEQFSSEAAANQELQVSQVTSVYIKLST